MDRDDRATGLETVSTVVVTAGRIEPLLQLLHCLAGQTHPVTEVIVVDQGPANLPESMLDAVWPFTLRYIHCPERHGGGRARNTGWRQAQGDWLLFPDELCRYPRDYLARALALVRRYRADITTGRAADPAGAILGRFGTAPRWISHRTVLTSQAEWNMLIRRNAMRQLGGYDEAAPAGGEGYDLLFRAVALDIACRYEPELVAHLGERRVGDADRDETLRRGRDHARGLGRALAVHGFGLPSAAYWIARSIANLSIAALRGGRVSYYMHQAVGRLEGFFDCSLPYPRYPQASDARRSRELPGGRGQDAVRAVQP